MTTPKTFARCDACRFWDPDGRDPEDGVGECHRHAPKPQEADSNGDRPHAPFFPEAFYLEWCGDFSAGAPGEVR